MIRTADPSTGRLAVKRRRRWLLWLGLWLGLALLLLCIGALTWFHLQMTGALIPKERMIATTLNWARLDPFPSSMSDFSIHATGNIFTRGFRSHFKAPITDINAWLSSSPGTKGLTPKWEKNKRLYVIEPGDGATWAEVTVDEEAESVEVYAYWS